MIDWLEVREFFKDIFKYILIAVVVLVIFLYVATFQQVVGPSMNTTLSNGDVLLLNKLNYHLFDVKRNEVVSFTYADTKYLIKRIIGLPGEEIEYKDNLLYINGKAYEESYALGNTEDFSIKSLTGEDKIPEDMYLVLGDNREDSLDSRSFGLIKKKDLIGKVTLRIWPINKLKAVK